MRVHIECTEIYMAIGSVDTSKVDSQPDSGANIHGFFMENSRWDPDATGTKDKLEISGQVPVDEIASAKGSVVDSKPKELYPIMPMLHLTGRTVADCVPEVGITEGRYICPFYTTTIRGPTYVFAGPLRSNVSAEKWILAGSALVMQSD